MFAVLSACQSVPSQDWGDKAVLVMMTQIAKDISPSLNHQPCTPMLPTMPSTMPTDINVGSIDGCMPNKR
ncbi:MAG: hypothetical protein Q4A69_02675 [Moraxella sp.]|nr:hypothetical protein [Moraxella sp.]